MDSRDLQSADSRGSEGTCILPRSGCNSINSAGAKTPAFGSELEPGSSVHSSPVRRIASKGSSGEENHVRFASHGTDSSSQSHGPCHSYASDRSHLHGATVACGPRHSEPSPTLYKEASKLPQPKCNMIGYLALNSVVVFTTSGFTVLVWSNVGIGEQCMDFIMSMDQLGIYNYTCASFFALLVLLYVLDFYVPFHLPGRFFRFHEGDTYLGRSVLTVAMLLGLLSCFLMAHTLPGAPVLLMLGLSPTAIVGIRYCVMPAGGDELFDRCEREGDLQTKVLALLTIMEREDDTLAFARGALVAFVVGGGSSLVVWFRWAVATNQVLYIRHVGEQSALDREVSYFLWVSPLMVACSNFAFGIFVTIKVMLQRAYASTDRTKGKLVISVMNSWTDQSIASSRQSLRNRLNINPDLYADISREQAALMEQSQEDRIEQAVTQVVQVMKIAGCVFVSVLGLMYVAGQLFAGDIWIQETFMFAVVLFFAMFVAFLYNSFQRIMSDMGRKLKDRSFWKTLQNIFSNDWVRSAYFLFPTTAVVPAILVLSIANQAMRRLRGLYDEAPPEYDSEAGGEGSCVVRRVSSRVNLMTMPKVPAGAEATLIVTPLIYSLGLLVGQWNWIKIIFRIYVLSAAYVLYNLCPLLLNVLLSWLTSILAECPFGIIVGSTFAVGLVAFLLPPVPGLTVYVFGGLVISSTCPWGFWPGSIFNICLCFVLKLTACAVQQKCIGGFLGQSQWVRHTVGIHKPAIRAIEALLRHKGFTVPKVAILCGGPDWPTSVLAGVLGLSLFQCEMGTVPIIAFVAPCALAGSFFLKKGTNAMWTRMANLMTVISLLVNIVLMALATWAIQCELVEKAEEFSKPLPENVDLEWLDYKAAQLDLTCSMTWDRVPKYTRSAYLLGAFAQVVICQALYWRYSRLFGTFKVSDNIYDLRWYGSQESGALITPGALVLFVFYVASWFLFAQFQLWKRWVTGNTRKTKFHELDQVEATWKQERLRQAIGAQAPGFPSEDTERSVHSGPKAVPTMSFQENSCNSPPPSFSPKQSNARDDSRDGHIAEPEVLPSFGGVAPFGNSGLDAPAFGQDPVTSPTFGGAGPFADGPVLGHELRRRAASKDSFAGRGRDVQVLGQELSGDVPGAGSEDTDAAPTLWPGKEAGDAVCKPFAQTSAATQITIPPMDFALVSPAKDGSLVPPMPPLPTPPPSVPHSPSPIMRALTLAAQSQALRGNGQENNGSNGQVISDDPNNMRNTPRIFLL